MSKKNKFLWICQGLMLLLLSVSQIVHARSIKKIKKIKPPEFSCEIDVPLNFGKTHFIIGYTDTVTSQEPKQQKTSSSESDTTVETFVCDGCVKRALFAPDDNIQKALLYLIEQEKESIKLAIFTFTDGDVAQALIDAQERGVIVEIIADAGSKSDRFSKIPLLKEKGFTVFVYDPDYKKGVKKSLMASIMHNKFLVFGKNILGKSLVWTGSFNITKSAHRQNQENVLVLDDTKLIQKYAQQFEILKERSRAPKKNNTQQQEEYQKLLPTMQLSKRGTVFEDIDFILA